MLPKPPKRSEGSTLMKAGVLVSLRHLFARERGFETIWDGTWEHPFVRIRPMRSRIVIILITACRNRTAF